MKTIKIAVLATALVALTVSANAQPQRRGAQPSPEKIAEVATDRMDQRLDLSDKQESKILAINLKYAKANAATKTRVKRPEAGKKASDEDRKAMMEHRKEMMKAQKESRQAQKLEIMSHLNDEQKLKYAEMVASPSKTRAKRGNQVPQKGKMRGPVRSCSTQCKMKK